MNIKLRKQFSKNYQVFEIELDNVPQNKIDDANTWMDKIGLREIEKMGNSVQITQSVASNTSTVNQSGSNNPATVKQITWLDKHNVKYNPNTITSKEASLLLDEVFGKDKKKSKNNKSTETINRDDMLSDSDLPF